MNSIELHHRRLEKTKGGRLAKAKCDSDCRIVSVAVFIAVLAAGCASHPTPSNISVGEALAVPDDSKVVVTGRVVQQIDADHFLLRDDTGSITAHIDDDLLGEVKVAPEARLRLSGSVDQDHKPPLLNVKTVQLVQ